MFAGTTILSSPLIRMTTTLLLRLLSSLDRWTMPRYSGQMELPGLQGRVDVVRDKWGVPHIYAQNDEDLFFAQGYIHAQDRLWQMELQRRIGHGQLAEIFGRKALNTDRFLRVLGFRRVVEQEASALDEETKRILNSYIQGVNIYLQQHRYRLPIEFLILRFRPRAWTVQDVLVIGKVLALDLSWNWMMELLRARIVATVGSERANEIDPGQTKNRMAGYYKPTLSNDIPPQEEPITILKGNEIGQGSNCWVVGGKRSATGKPLLANDMHLQIQMPSLWYENHLIGDAYRVTGASVPGGPGVIVGHNAAISWGITNGMADVQDLYIEKFDPENPTLYEYCGQWKQAEVVREKILVRGQRHPHIEEVMLTQHGPVINPLLSQELQQLETKQILTLRWTALQPGSVNDPILALNRAQDWETFRQAVAKWKSPVLNFLYADQLGHIGYIFAGDLPIRRNSDGRIPVEGWHDGFAWDGHIPASELPYCFDPPEQTITSANNKPVDDTYPYPIYGEWDTDYRVKRIRDLLESGEKHDIASFKAMQGDCYSIPGSILVKFSACLQTPTPVAKAALDAFSSWDCLMVPESVGATIYARFCAELLVEAYKEVKEPLEMIIALGNKSGNGYLRKALSGVLHRLSQQDDEWLIDRTWEQVLNEAWLTSLRILEDEYGDDVTQWHYSRQHTVLMSHILGAVPILRSLFNRGPFSVGGDANTLQMFLSNPANFAPTYRQICDPADWDNSVSIHSSGQSGQPSNPHYDDFIPLWLAMEYHPMLWSDQHITKVAKHRLVLVPSK